MNQWLEATVLDVVVSSDLEREEAAKKKAADDDGGGAPSPTPTPIPQRTATMDPAVSTTNIIARNALLKNPDDKAQILLIHYNGWPQRWDEWIRGDSLRLRPFRTRTKHGASAPHASPTPVTIVEGAPTTRICVPSPSDDRPSEDDASEEPDAILPELCRVLGGVMNEVEEIQKTHNNADAKEESNTDVVMNMNRKLPWHRNNSSNSRDDSSDDDSLKVTRAVADKKISDLKRIAPLLDRLGRLLTDSAVAVNKMSDNLKKKEVEKVRHRVGGDSCEADHAAEEVAHEEEEAYEHELDEAEADEEEEEEDLYSPPRSPVRLASSAPNSSHLFPSSLSQNTPRNNRSVSDASSPDSSNTQLDDR